MSFKMVGFSNVDVQITSKSKCIYKNSFGNKENELDSLISNLRYVQQKVNEILSELVQVEQKSNQDENSSENESKDSDNLDDKDGNAIPKKHKSK